MGDTAIMIGALIGRYEIVQLLRKAGARIDMPGWTPLHYAAFGGHARICEFLIEQGAPINAPAPNGTTPLMMAAREGRGDVIRILLAARADPNAATDTGRTALQWASAAGNSEIMDLLKAAGAKE
ncbi:MAG: ankyrin repeat domain-containing protein [Gammaproteobacteria bacterium]|nr:ankyrin repeat domain-containing protein [Gammaproteobacteria bacterium]